MSKHRYTVVRSLTINTPANRVFPLINHLKSWPQWSPWELDPNVKREYSGPESGVNASYCWDGNRKMGAGKMTITHVIENQQIDIALQFYKPFKSQSNATFFIHPQGEKCEVQWQLEGEYTGLFKLLKLLFPMDKMCGPQFETGLNQLKLLVER